MFAATTDELLTIKLALKSARAPSDAVDARGVGAAMAPFSLASFYNGCMAVLCGTRCTHFLWLVHRDRLPSATLLRLFVWLISHQPTVLFSHNKSATNNQPAVLFSQNKSAPAISHQPPAKRKGCYTIGTLLSPLTAPIVGSRRLNTTYC
jgi:hypothetical protein